MNRRCQRRNRPAATRSAAAPGPRSGCGRRSCARKPSDQSQATVGWKRTDVLCIAPQDIWMPQTRLRQRRHRMIYCAAWPPNIPCFRPAVVTSLETFDVRFPTSRELDGSDAMNPDPDYSAAYVVLRTDAARRARGPRLRVHHRARQRRPGRGDPRARAVRRRPAGRATARWARSGGRLVHDSQLRWLGPGEGRHAHGDLRRGQRALGPGGQARGQAAVAAAGRHVPGGARRPGRLPLPHRRAHAATRRWRSSGARSPAGPSASPQLVAATATPRTRRRPAGSATPTRSSRGCARRRSPTASPRSS